MFASLLLKSSFCVSASFERASSFSPRRRHHHHHQQQLRIRSAAANDDDDDDFPNDNNEFDYDVVSVPRNPGIKSGKWNQNDMEIVKTAQKDANEKASLTTSSLLAPSNDLTLLGLTENELKVFAERNGTQKFRGKQIKDFIYKHRVKSIMEMTQLPKDLRESWDGLGVTIGRNEVYAKKSAPDGTTKLLMKLDDNRIVETVGIPSNEYGKSRLTCCVSSQVGCPMRCEFCATGKGGFYRNLTAREIVDQVMAIEEEFGGRRVSNVVFMGMGEPMLNVPNVVKATELLNKEIGIGMRHISISTVGVFGALEKLASYEMQCVLAVSLHAPNQKIREEIIPSARAYSFDDILNDCVAYFNATGRRVTFEYTLLAGVNDQKEHAKELASVLFKKNLASHVNLIPYNPVDDSDFKRPTKQAIDQFRRILEENNVPTSVRQTRGLEAAAACGQLRNMYQKEALVA